jgi:hypothetical protein
MPRSWSAPVPVLALAALATSPLTRRLRRGQRPPVAEAVISDPSGPTSLDDLTGAVRSVQAADIFLPTQALHQIWTPMHLERLARTYWRFLTRVTLGLIRIAYTERERFIVLLTRPFVLMRFQAPEYAMDTEHGVVRWRIERGILVARQGRGNGYLEIEIERRGCDEPGMACLHVQVAVANFYPSIAATFSRPVYRMTQAFVHVLVTHAFLRSLARLDLARSRAGRLEGVASVSTARR